MASRSVNKVILLGHVGKDAETKFTPSGTAKTSFTLATNRRWQDKQSGEWKEETDWHNITLWKMEGIANYLLKGKQVYVEGRISTRSYEDKDGKKNYFTEVVADNVILLSSGAGRGEEGGDFAPASSGPVSMPRSARPAAQPRQSAGGESPESNQGITDDDVPF